MIEQPNSSQSVPKDPQATSASQQPNQTADQQQTQHQQTDVSISPNLDYKLMLDEKAEWQFSNSDLNRFEVFYANYMEGIKSWPACMSRLVRIQTTQFYLVMEILPI